MTDVYSKNKKKRGRPLKYHHVLASLEDHELYSPASMAHRAVVLGQIHKAAIKSLRSTVRQFARYHQFPIHGDGLVTTTAQAPKVGYFGRRWKAAAGLTTEE